MRLDYFISLMSSSTNLYTVVPVLLGQFRHGGESWHHALAVK